jgi:hypothetical protein
MLMTKDYSKDDIVSFKMVNGDEIVARVVSNVSDGWQVARPCTVIPGPQGIGLMQSLISADINTEVTIGRQHVMLHAPVIKQMQDHYIQTTTGIQTVSKGSILT